MSHLYNKETYGDSLFDRFIERKTLNFIDKVIDNTDDWVQVLLWFV